MQEVNEIFLKFSSKVPFSKDYNIKLGDDLKVTVDTPLGFQSHIFNVVKEETNDNQDGTVNKTFVCKSLVE